MLTDLHLEQLKVDIVLLTNFCHVCEQVSGKTIELFPSKVIELLVCLLSNISSDEAVRGVVHTFKVNKCARYTHNLQCSDSTDLILKLKMFMKIVIAQVQLSYPVSTCSSFSSPSVITFHCCPHIYYNIIIITSCIALPCLPVSDGTGVNHVTCQTSFIC